MAPAGVGCVRADANIPAEFWLQDEQAVALGLTQKVTHPALGDYQRHGANVMFDRIIPELKPPPMAGQHNEELLQSLGYSAQEVAGLEAAGTIWREKY